MKRSLLAIAGLLVLLLGLAIHPAFPTGAAIASSGLVGSWRVTVSPTGLPPSPSLITFAADGTMLVADPPVEPAGPGAPFKLGFNSGGHGAWTSTGDRTLAFTFVELQVSETGAFVGTLTVRGTSALDAAGALTGRFSFDIADPTGKVVLTAAGTFQGGRIGVEPMGTPVATPGS